jgi:hypothetical protein
MRQEQPTKQHDDPSVPTPKFRRASWNLLQLKLDPLALPRPLPTPQP